jgi:serine/threonine protein kinase
MSSRTITTVVTSDTIALNAAVFGYAGHSIVTPQFAIKQIWWTEERINAKVTRDFISSKLKPEERGQLGQQVAFGNELTDYKYIDWILGKAKRLFLILVEIGVPDQIFGVVDDVWDDTDLPIPLSDIDNLALSYRTDENINRKFYNVQFQFLLRPLIQDAHIQYGINEVIPLEYVHRLPPAAALQSWLRMHLPKKPHEVFVRRKINLGTSSEKTDDDMEAQFKADIQKSRLVQHKHVSDVWASYTTKGTGYFLTTFEAEHTLKSFIEFRSAASLQKLTKNQRNEIFLTWLHCLADALAAIHQSGLQHTAITPSNILIDGKNQIAFSDIGSLKSFQTDKKADPAEIYNYGAPENHGNETLPFLNTFPEALDVSPSRFNRHKRSMDSNMSSLSKSQSRQSKGSSIYSMASTPEMSPPGLQTPSASSMSSMDSPATPTSDTSPTQPNRPPPPLPKDEIYLKQAAALANTMSLFNVRHSRLPTPPATPGLPQEVPAEFRAQQADIFSLGCVFLDILTYMVKKKLGDFIKHRTTKRTPASPAKQHPNHYAKTDSSFQYNLNKVIAWTEQLQAEAVMQEDVTFRAVPRLIRLVRSMISPNPAMRPNAAEVRERIFDILIGHAGIEQICCSSSHKAPTPGPLIPRLAPPPKGIKGSAEPRIQSELTMVPAPAFDVFQKQLPPLNIPKRGNTTGSMAKRGNTTADSHHGFGGFVRGFKWGARKQTL